MEKNLNKFKYCDVGSHSVAKLFHARKPDRPSCCHYCYRSPPIKKSPKIKPQSEHLKNSMRVQPKKEDSKETIQALLRAAEIVFNRWIRKRDTEPNGFTFVCIACNLAYPVELMDAGHFYSKTYSAIRFHEDNLHGECQLCNRMDIYHLIGYEFNLINKIGTERFKALTELKNKPKKWDRQELLEIINKYKL